MHGPHSMPPSLESPTSTQLRYRCAQPRFLTTFLVDDSVGIDAGSLVFHCICDAGLAVLGSDVPSRPPAPSPNTIRSTHSAIRPDSAAKLAGNTGGLRGRLLCFVISCNEMVSRPSAGPGVRRLTIGIRTALKASENMTPV